MTHRSEVINDNKFKPYLDHGFVGLIGVFGDDKAIEQAARMSYGEGTRQVSETRGLLRFLLRHEHSSPFEMCDLKFHIKMPIFVMRQFVRHRTASLNEYSGRYSEMVDEFYLPPTERIRGQAKDNKQGSSEEIVDGSNAIQRDMETDFRNCYDHYKAFCDKGVARELARINLPVSNYTELVWKCNLRNFMHMLKLRLDKHAQEEIRILAQAMYDLAKPHFPLAFEAFEDYVLNAKSFNSIDRILFKTLFDSADLDTFYHYVDGLDAADPVFKKLSGVSKREIEEFAEKLRWLVQ